MIVSRDVTFDEESMLKVPTGENVKALDESEKSKVVQTKMSTPVMTILVQSKVTASVDCSDSNSENVEIPIEGSSQQQEVPSLVSGWEPRARRALQRFDYEDNVAYALLVYGNESSS